MDEPKAYKVQAKTQIPVEEESTHTSSSSIPTEDMNATAELIQAIMDLEMNGDFNFPTNQPEDVNVLPPKEYLDATVIPILLYCLERLNRLRPPNPLKSLCTYLLQFRSKFDIKIEENEKNEEEEEEKEQD